MHAQLSNPNFYIMLLADAICCALALGLAYLIRFEFQVPEAFADQYWRVLPQFVLVKLALFYLLGLYRGMWRYTSVYELRRLAAASLLSSLVLLAATVYLRGNTGYSRAVFILDLGLTVGLCTALRLAIRTAFERRSRPLGATALAGAMVPSPGPVRVLIVGAGRAGEQVLRALLQTPGQRYQAVGFLDDDPGRRGRSIHGVAVRGQVTDLPQVAKRTGASEVLIAMPSATGQEMRRVVGVCEQTGLPFKTLPAMTSLIDGSVSVQALRAVNFEDLLGRQPVVLDTDRVRESLQGKVVLVTGCGGSIGSELCRQIVAFAPRRLLLLDASEFNLYQMQMELHHKLGFTAYCPILDRLQDPELLAGIFRTHRPQVIFHAAAYKHVPLLERNPWEAVTNNIETSRLLLDTAVAHGVERFVLVSTDKAVRPTNVMGASKRVTELLLQARVGQGTRLMSVRFGNVVGSSGSVIPLFLEQIARGGPVTVTHPEVTRYFMTIGEAAQLILQAGSMGGEGEIFLLKMGTPVRIADMAQDLIRLAGKEPGRDVEIRYTGLRPGEKLYEELITDGEGVVATGHDKIMLLRADDGFQGLGSRPVFHQWLEQGVAELRELAAACDGPAIKTRLVALVPEYTPAPAPTILDAPTAPSGQEGS